MPTTAAAAADPSISDHIAKLIETGIASAIDSIRRELRQPDTSNATATAPIPTSNLQVQPTDTAVGALSPASVVVAGPATLAAPSSSLPTQGHPSNHPANHVNEYQPTITATPPALTTSGGAAHIRDNSTASGAPHNNNTSNMAAPYSQLAQPAGHNATPWRPPPRAGPTGNTSAAIPPADLLLPYVDQSTLNALANLDGEVPSIGARSGCRPHTCTNATMSIPLATQQLTELATAYIHNSVAGTRDAHTR
ncbi:uncharacterized protein [Ptychodera flava]|uniref:uncharacterized protein n=1 Tax=Ptychodera flava TaxID=63121 RepID=UPI00396A0466